MIVSWMHMEYKITTSPLSRPFHLVSKDFMMQSLLFHWLIIEGLMVEGPGMHQTRCFAHKSGFHTLNREKRLKEKSRNTSRPRDECKVNGSRLRRNYWFVIRLLLFAIDTWWALNLCVCVSLFIVEWSCLKDFSLLAGEMVLDDLQTLKCTISGLTTVIAASPSTHSLDLGTDNVLLYDWAVSLYHKGEEITQSGTDLLMVSTNVSSLAENGVFQTS